MTNPYDIFKEQMKQLQANKEAAKRAKELAQAQRLQNNLNNLNETLRRLQEQLMYDQLNWSRPSNPFGQGYTSSTYTAQQPPRQAYVPGWCKVLGLPATASPAEIKSRYRTLAKEHHPDKGGNPETFNNITKAYQEATR